MGGVLLGSKPGGEVRGAVTSQTPVAILAGTGLMYSGAAGPPSRQCLQVTRQPRPQRPGQEGGCR